MNSCLIEAINFLWRKSMPAGFFTSIWSLQTEAGNYLQGSIVCYAEDVKINVLNVPNSFDKTVFSRIY
ncbi:Uncharacterised protein [Sphingobacterium daejeonense]|nr:Uncharacterised protein [Sphingobacterium daejeonense]